MSQQLNELGFQELEFEYNPVLELFDKYVCKRFEGTGEDQSFLESLVAVQTELLKRYARHEEKVQWLLKAINDKNIYSSLELEYAKQYTAKKRANLH